MGGQERDGHAPIRPDDLFFPNWIDLDRKPLPRFWYLPRSAKAAVVATGDDHAGGGTAGRFDKYKANSSAGCVVANWECLRFTSYIYPDTALSNAQAVSYTADGFEVGLHVNTDCEDWTPTTLETFYATQLSEWSQKYTGVPPLHQPDALHRLERLVNAGGHRAAARHPAGRQLLLLAA